MGPYLRYTLLRLLLLVTLFAVVWSLGARGVLAIVLAAVGSMALSYVLLSRQRDRVVESLVARRQRADTRGEDERAEDDQDRRSGNPADV